jgi:hypothetical protein
MALTIDDLDKRCGTTVEDFDDPSLCECGLKAVSLCTATLDDPKGCPMFPDWGDDRWPSAEERWRRGY